MQKYNSYFQSRIPSLFELLQSLRILSQRTNPDNPKFKTLIIQCFIQHVITRTIHKNEKRKLNELSKLCNISRFFFNFVLSEISFRVRFSCQLITGRKEISSLALVDIIFRGIRIPQDCVRRKSSKTVRHCALITFRVQVNIFSFFDGQDSKFEKRKENRVPWRYVPR